MARRFAELGHSVVGCGRDASAAASGVMHVVRAFLPAMIERRRGVVVNFSSGWGTSTSPYVASYCASKHAIEGLTGALAQELPEGLAAVNGRSQRIPGS